MIRKFDKPAAAVPDLSVNTDIALTSEKRAAPRHRVKWRAVLIDNEGQPHPGFIRDISISGTAVFVERNLRFRHNQIKLLLHALPRGAEAVTVISIQCGAAYAIYDGGENMFRIGLSFEQFENNDHQLFLQNNLAKAQSF